MVKLKKIFPIFFLLILTLPLQLLGDDKNTNHINISVADKLPIKNVVLYSDRASINRIGKIRLAKGLNRLQVKGLSPVLLEDSLRLNWKSDSVKLLSIFTFKENIKTTKNEELKYLQNKQKQLSQNILENRQKIKTNNITLSYISKYRIYAKETMSEDSISELLYDTGEWDKTLNFLALKEKTYHQMIRKLESQNVILKEKISILTKKINKIIFPASKKIRITEVLLWSDSNTFINLNLSYIVFHCSWKPHYSVRLNEKKLNIEYYGKISQRTGEDWNNIKMTLSTAKPNKGLARTKTYATRLYSYKLKSNSQSFHVGTVRREEKKVMLEDKRNEEDSENLSKNKRTKKLANSVVFQVGSGINIPSGKKKGRVLITTIKTTAKTKLEVLPALKTLVYSQVLSKNNSPYPLLSGKADIFKNTVYSGFGKIDFVSPQSKFKMTVGIHRKILVKRKEIPHKIESNLLGSSKTYHKTYQIVIQNLSKGNKEIEITENIPVSLVENYSVKLNTKKTSTFAKWNKKTGIIKWKRELGGKEKKVITLDYSITVPSSYRGKF